MENDIVEVKTKHGTFKYKKWVWDLAWWAMFLLGVLLGVSFCNN